MAATVDLRDGPVRLQVSEVTDADVLPVGLFPLALLGPSTAVESEHNLDLQGSVESS